MLSILADPVCWGGLVAFILGQLAIDCISAMQYKKDKKAMQKAAEHRQHQYA